MIFDITKSNFDTTNSILWYKKITIFCDIKKYILLYHKIEYVISQIRFFDTTKSIFDTQN